AVQSMTGMVPMKACAVTGTSRPMTVAKEKTTNLLECCRIDFLSILQRRRSQPLWVSHAEPVDDFQSREFGMLLGKFLTELGFKRIAGARPIIKWRSRKLDHGARFRLVGDEHVGLREMTRDVPQLFDRFDRRL